MADGILLQGRRFTLTFDPDLIREASYGTLTFSVQVEHLHADTKPNDSVHSEITLPDDSRHRGSSSSPTVLGSYIYTPGSASPIVTISVGIPSRLGLSLPRSLGPRLETVLAGTILGQEAVDIKFYAFSRKGAGYVARPCPTFAKSSLLAGYSDFLDLLISGDGYTESNVVDLDRHVMEESFFEEYDYMSDSDLDPETENEDDDVPVTESSELTIPLPPSRPQSPVVPESRRMGRAVIIRDTAFKTWNALLYYLYTKKVRFASDTGTTDHGYISDAAPLCSSKSMYRLADKASTTNFLLDLDELKALSLASIQSRISSANIIQEAFSKFTAMYPEVQDIEVAFLVDHLSEAELELELDGMLKRVCAEERPHCFDVLRKIVSAATRKLPMGAIIVTENFQGPRSARADSPEGARAPSPGVYYINSP
ncbi:hypothetical protein C8J57DRAFT_1044987 [Mycena rebaudengoi]|nr:hypothetical protein C8J57DRAFT_1044987 [Mycena rebaudengoi]